MLILIYAFAYPARSEELEEATFSNETHVYGAFYCKSGMYVEEKDLMSVNGMNNGKGALYVTKLTTGTPDWKTKAEGISFKIVQEDANIGSPYSLVGFSKYDIKKGRTNVFGWSLDSVQSWVKQEDFSLYERDGKKIVTGEDKYTGGVIIDSNGNIYTDSLRIEDDWSRSVFCDYPRDGLISRIDSYFYTLKGSGIPIIIKYSRHTHPGYWEKESSFSF